MDHPQASETKKDVVLPLWFGAKPFQSWDPDEMGSAEQTLMLDLPACV